MPKALSPLLQIGLCIFGYLYATSNTALAQVTPDGTVNTQVNQNGNVAEITGGEARGSNLFHSFQEFSVPTNNEAFFNNANNISNIFSRVTGSQTSNIDGAIRANGSASLFLVNPAGIIFGEGASLSLGGSFYGSSASSILFEDGEFSAADLENPPLLTVNAPVGLSFRDEPGDLVNRSTFNNTGLAVNEGQNISLIGGNITIENGGIVFAPGGKIELGGLLEAGTIDLAEDSSLSFPDSVIRSNVSLTDSAIVSVLSNGGGSIGINAANLEIINGSRFISSIRAETGSPDAQAGDIVIDASDSVLIDGQGNSDVSTGVFSNVGSSAVGNGGNINITTESLTITDRGVLDAATLGQGNAGNITVNARDSISLKGDDSGTVNNTAIRAFSGDMAQGDAGNIRLNTGSLTLNNRTGLLAPNFANGKGGNVTINATDNVSFSNSSDVFVTGAEGGSIQLDAKNLSITSDSKFFAGIPSNSGFPEAQSGDINLNLTEDLVLDGLDGESLTFITNTSFGTGNPGDININARNITFKNGGNVSIFSTTQQDGKIGNITLNARGDILFDGIKSPQRSGIFNSIPEGASGEIGAVNVQAQNLTLTNGATIGSQVVGNADSGDIDIEVANSIKIDGFDKISPESTPLASSIFSEIQGDGVGNSGNINIKTQNLELSRNGSIRADLSGTGNAGDINIDAQQITIGKQGNSSIVPSTISAETFLGSSEANGGNITINTDSLFISDGGTINVGISGVGDGGNIKINARDIVSVDGTGILLDSEISSGITADTFDSIGNAGNIEIDTANLSVTNGAFISADILPPRDNNSENINNPGNGGSISINASNSINVSGEGGIEADILDENSTGNGGNLTLETARLTVEDGAQISAITFGDGDAGSLTINASESIELKGFTEIGRGGLFASALQGSGNGGDVNVFTNKLTISDGAIITASNFSSLREGNNAAAPGTRQPGTGQPGNINIEANSINLDTEGRIEAVTQSADGEGANITLQVAEDITLQNDSFISAQAINQANGGNLTIDSRFIIAFPQGNNDIIANAEQGNGGNINITAESLFGIEERPLKPNTNDINASSEFSLDGTVTINTPDINPVQGATELPSNVIEPQQTTTQACQANREIAAQNGLTIKGKGGVPPAPDLPLNSQNIFINGEITDSTASVPQPIETSQGKIQPARGIKVSEDGKITLTAYRTNNAGARLTEIKPNCS